MLSGTKQRWGFFQLIWGNKQSFTVIASWCTTVHNRMTNIYLPFTRTIPQNFKCKSLFVLQDWQGKTKIFSIPEYLYSCNISFTLHWWKTLKAWNATRYVIKENVCVWSIGFQTCYKACKLLYWLIDAFIYTFCKLYITISNLSN